MSFPTSHSFTLHTYYMKKIKQSNIIDPNFDYNNLFKLKFIQPDFTNFKVKFSSLNPILVHSI